MKRRQFLQSLAAGSAAASVTLPGWVLAQPEQTLRLGVLPKVLDCDAHLILGEYLGAWKQQGLKLETTNFVTGLETYQALAGGSVDLVSTGAVISNFPARGQGKAFLVNGLESGISQIWVHPDLGINSIADLKGKKIATTRGTTAHFFLHRVLVKAGLDSTKDVEIVHQRMDQAVTSFIARQVPAVAIWLPFDNAIRQHSQNARQLASSTNYPDATVVGGWSARNNLLAENPQLLERFIRGWMIANDFLIDKTNDALLILSKEHYKDVPPTQLRAQFDAVRWFKSKDWVQYYKDGSVQKWLNRVTDFNVEVGAIKNPLRAEQYFDPQLYLRAQAKG